jgi:hypothetical protein
VSQIGDWQASTKAGRLACMAFTRPARAQRLVFEAVAEGASMISDQTHGGWKPPHEPSASCRSRTQRSATLIACRRRAE